MTRLAWHEREYWTFRRQLHAWILFVAILAVTRPLLAIDRLGLPMPGFAVRLAERLARRALPYAKMLFQHDLSRGVHQ